MKFKSSDNDSNGFRLRKVKRWIIVAIDKETGEVHKAPYHFTTEEEAQKALDIMSIPPIAKNFVRKIEKQHWSIRGSDFEVCVREIEESLERLF